MKCQLCGQEKVILSFSVLQGRKLVACEECTDKEFEREVPDIQRLLIKFRDGTLDFDALMDKLNEGDI